MPLFSRRRGSTGQYNNAAVSSSATIAATSAFLKTSPSTASLSSAAAAAALRSHATSPEPVGSIQTKRMIRRGSQSSIGSAAPSLAPPQTRRPLSRSGSQSSMTERSFRSPSPGGRTPSNAARPAAADAPPVPAVRMPPTSNTTRPRTRSNEVPPTARPASALGRMQGARSPSPGAVNFSRPMGSPADSPQGPPSTSKRGSWFGGPTVSNGSPRHTGSAQQKQPISITPQEVASIQARLQAAANSPTTKKNSSSSSALQGARLAAGTIAQKSDGTATPKKTQQTTRPQPQTNTQQTSTTKRAPTPNAVARNDGAKSPTPSIVNRTAGNASKRSSVVINTPPVNGTTKDVSRQVKAPVSAPSTEQSGNAHRRGSSATLEVPDAHGKSAHFSTETTDATKGVRHDPPGRSVSPAKSAMKHSPASSVRTTSPSGNSVPNHKGPGSDTSDTMSMTSQDGLRNGRKKKARVSFIEDMPAVVIADPTPTSRTRASSQSEDDTNELMKPRPALPSFGSVRARDNENGTAEKVTETLTGGQVSEGVSSDHAIGGLLHNQSDLVTANGAPKQNNVPILEVNGHLADKAMVEVPDIAVHPATPGVEEEPTKVVETPKVVEQPPQPAPVSRFRVPGGWDDMDDYAEPELTLATIVEAPGDESGSDDEAAFSDAAEEPSPTGFASLNAIVESPISAKSGKFAKTPTAEDWERTSAYWSQHKKMLQERASANKQDDVFGVSNTKQLEASDAKQVAEHSESEYEEDEPAAPLAPVSAPVSAPIVKEAPQPAAQPQQQAKPIKSAMRTSMRGPTPEPTPAPSQTTMRKSMRQNGASAAPAAKIAAPSTQPAMQRKTMRPSSTSEVVAVKQVPPVLAKTTRTTTRDDSDSESSFRKKRRPTAVSESGRYTMRRSMRAGSIDSTQERPSPAQAPPGSGKWSVRSMSPVQSSQNNRAAFRQSMRPMSVSDAPTMRGDNSRAKQASGKPTNRFSMSGFSKASKPADAPSVASKSRYRSRFADSDSDNDDGPSTERSLGGGFRSRFADSDDEGEPQRTPAGLKPVRGIPHPMTARDESSELDDSSDGEARPRSTAGQKVVMRSKVKPIVPELSDIDRAMAQARLNVAAMTGNQQVLQAQPARGRIQRRSSSRPASVIVPPSQEESEIQRPRGLLGSIFGRRHSNASVMSLSQVGSHQNLSTPAQTPPMSPSSGRGRLQRRNTPKMLRTTSGLSVMTSTSNMQPATNAPNWPLTPEPTATEAPAKYVRPSTSDGVPESRRSKQEIPPVPPLPTIGVAQNGTATAEVKEEKKKRFGKLRRAFGL